jgi:glycosyltransferase involved in cell wall biosynthesis
MMVLESMAFGKPIIGSRIGGIPEQICLPGSRICKREHNPLLMLTKAVDAAIIISISR